MGKSKNKQKKHSKKNKQKKKAMGLSSSPNPVGFVDTNKKKPAPMDEDAYMDWWLGQTQYSGSGYSGYSYGGYYGKASSKAIDKVAYEVFGGYYYGPRSDEVDKQ